MLGLQNFGSKKPGLQPDGFTLVLDDGSTVDTRQALPRNLFDAASRVGGDFLPSGSPLGPRPPYATPPYAPTPDEGALPPEWTGGGGIAPSPAGPGPVTLPRGMFGGGPSASAQPAPPAQPSNFGMDPIALPSGRVSGPMTVDPAALQTSLSSLPMTHAKPSFFGPGGLGSRIVNGLDAFSTTYLANQGMPGAQAQLAQRLRQPELDRQYGLDRQKQAFDLMKATQPEIRSAGRSIVSVPFGGGDPTVLYSDPIEAQRYAEQLGLRPGDPGYAAAVTDYTLKAYGPTAQTSRAAQENLRQDNRVALEGARQGNRLQLRSTPTYSNLHPTTRSPAARQQTTGTVVAPILAKVAQGQPLTPGEQTVLNTYYRRGNGGRGGSGGGAGGIALPPSSIPMPPPSRPAPANAPVRVQSPAQAAKLAPGTHFIGPDGVERVRH